MKQEKSNTPTKTAGSPKRLFTFFLAGFTCIGLLWIFVFSDFVAQDSYAQQKDYAAEEVLNKELAKQMVEGASTIKMLDENATQYVNNAIADIVEDESEEEDEEEKKPIVEEPDPVGEEF